jgi:ankyrin repeat protein
LKPGRPLVLAIINGHFDTAAFLLDRKADPNAADAQGRAPLFAAVDMRDIYQSNRPSPKDTNKVDPLDLIKMLLAAGADPNAKLTKLIPPRGARLPRHDYGRRSHSVPARRQIGRYPGDAAFTRQGRRSQGGDQGGRSSLVRGGVNVHAFRAEVPIRLRSGSAAVW